MAMASWHLNSSSGRESVRWQVSSHRPDAFVCDILLSGQYFGATLGGSSTEPPDYSLVLKSLTIGVEELGRLAAFLSSWLALPIAEQARHPPAFECAVGGLFDQIILMELRERSDVLSGGKPVVSFRYITGRLKGELSFVTDQSCLRELSEGIGRALAEEPSETSG